MYQSPSFFPTGNCLHVQYICPGRRFVFQTEISGEYIVLVSILLLFYFFSSLRRGDQFTVFCIVSFDFNWSRSPKIQHPLALVCRCGLANITRMFTVSKKSFVSNRNKVKSGTWASTQIVTEVDSTSIRDFIATWKKSSSTPVRLTDSCISAQCNPTCPRQLLFTDPAATWGATVQTIIIVLSLVVTVTCVGLKSIFMLYQHYLAIKQKQYLNDPDTSFTHREVKNYLSVNIHWWIIIFLYIVHLTNYSLYLFTRVSRLYLLPPSDKPVPSKKTAPPTPSRYSVRMLLIGHFQILLCLCFKTSLSGNLSYENEFCINQSHFHKNGSALRLAFKQRHKGTRKWPIKAQPVFAAIHV